ncbi:hypothetical protein ABC383_15690 [Noviherbaspirillum sp. 1P10PC]|uniref:hypothetical protein n=1 Tax=Noviherbaspirillum sp. 1P10PC TaxID=3132292 RepID=UPI0039A1F1B8
MSTDKRHKKPSGDKLVEKQLVSNKNTLAERFSDLPFLPDCNDRPHYEPLADTVDHLRIRVLPGEKE